MSEGSQRVPFVQKQEKLDEFGQNRLTERSGLLYNIDGWGGYGKTYGFLHFPFWEKMKHQFRSCFALTPRCFIFSIELLPRVKE